MNMNHQDVSSGGTVVRVLGHVEEPVVYPSFPV